MRTFFYRRFRREKVIPFFVKISDAKKKTKAISKNPVLSRSVMGARTARSWRSCSEINDRKCSQPYHNKVAVIKLFNWFLLKHNRWRPSDYVVDKNHLWNAVNNDPKHLWSDQLKFLCFAIICRFTTLKLCPIKLKSQLIIHQCLFFAGSTQNEAIEDKVFHKEINTRILTSGCVIIDMCTKFG